MEKLFFDNWESLFRTFIIGVLAYIALIVMLRISGKRTLSQMREFDFIVTVALGSTLATVLLNKDVSLSDGILALALLILLQYVLAHFSVRPRSFSKLISSEPTLVFFDGRFLKKALKKERVTEGEVEAVLRGQGIADMKLVDAVIMEANGNFSVVKNRKTANGSQSSLDNVKRTND